MSEPVERDRPDGSGAVEDAHVDSAAEPDAAVGGGHNNLETADLSDTGIGLSVGEPNTFEPEEGGPA